MIVFNFWPLKKLVRRNWSGFVRSGKTDPVQFKGYFFLTGPFFAYKNGRFASSFLLLGRGLLYASKKVNVSFKSPFPKPHLNRTGSVLALPNQVGTSPMCRGLARKPSRDASEAYRLPNFCMCFLFISFSSPVKTMMLT